QVRQRADCSHKIGRPKSEAGERSVPLLPMVVNALREWKLACPKGELDLVFPNGRGRIESRPNIVKRALHPVQIAAGVTDRKGRGEDPRPHARRQLYTRWGINARAGGGPQYALKGGES